MGTEVKEFFDLVLFADPRKVRECLQTDPSLVGAKDEYGFTALHDLMTEDRPEVAQLLIDAGADVSARNDDQLTPLHLAQHRSLVELLVKHGADINARGTNGSTPLHIAPGEAEDTGSLEVIETLLELGADLSLEDADGVTPKQIAADREEPDKVALFERFEKRGPH